MYFKCRNIPCRENYASQTKVYVLKRPKKKKKWIAGNPMTFTNRLILDLLTMRKWSILCSWLVLMTAVVSNGHLPKNQNQYLSLRPEYYNAGKTTGTNNQQNNAIERPLLIGSFNVQTFGKKKLANSDVSRIVEEIVLRYDLIVIIEMMTNSSKHLQKFLWDVNRFAPEGVTYNMSISSDPTVNEFVAVFYRTDKLKLRHSESYYDPQKFYRRPYFMLFDSPTLRDMQQFGIIAYHVKPSEAVREISALAEVYDFMKIKNNMEDILLMGDFNADCDYVKEGDWDKIALWTRPEFTWIIDQNVDTTTNYRSCALDRFVYAGENMNDGVIISSARVFDFRGQFYLSMKEVREVSDHWPIEVKIRGKMSKAAETHLSSETCFIVRDTRFQNISKENILTASKLADFHAVTLPHGISLQNEAVHLEDTLEALKKLRKTLPKVISQEQEEAITYKVENGALQDESSNANVPKVIFRTVLTNLNKYSEISVCKTTTIN